MRSTTTTKRETRKRKRKKREKKRKKKKKRKQKEKKIKKGERKMRKKRRIHEGEDHTNTHTQTGIHARRLCQLVATPRRDFHAEAVLRAAISTP